MQYLYVTSIFYVKDYNVQYNFEREIIKMKVRSIDIPYFVCVLSSAK